MKRLLSVLLCVLMLAGCGAKSKSVPIKDGCFDITVAELVERVDKLSEGRGVPKLADLEPNEVSNLKSREGLSAKSYQTGATTAVGPCYDKKNNRVAEVWLSSSVTGVQEDAALQMGQYLAAFSKALSPGAKLNFDPGAAVASMTETTYVEDNLKITISPAGTTLFIMIQPNI